MKKFDKDGDGKLNEEERAEARKTMEARRQEALKKFDKDGDGKLNEEERKAAIAARPKPGETKEKEPEEKGKKNLKEKKKKGGEKEKRIKRNNPSKHSIVFQALPSREGFF